MKVLSSRKMYHCQSLSVLTTARRLSVYRAAKMNTLDTETQNRQTTDPSATASQRCDHSDYITQTERHGEELQML